MICFSSRPGRPPKRNFAYQTNNYSDDKHLKFASNLLFHFKHPIHSNSAFTPTLSHSYLSNKIQTTTTTPQTQSISSSKS